MNKPNETAPEMTKPILVPVGKYSRIVVFACKFDHCKELRYTEMGMIGHIIEDHESAS